MKPFSEQSYYELLDVTPQAGLDEIKEAFARASELFAEDSIAIYSLAEPEAAAQLRRRVLEAFEYLSDPDLRAEYDRSIGVEVSRNRISGEAVQMSLGEEFSRQESPLPPPLPAIRMTPVEMPVITEASPVQVVRASPSVRSKSSDISPDAEVNGELLRHVREAKGMSLALMAERTKISARHLENVEADRYDSLPATVYLRGILISVARELGLDPMRVSKSYLTLIK